MLNVTSGQTLYIEVGGPGGNGFDDGAPGFNGGGPGDNIAHPGSGGGGGASDVRSAPYAADPRLLVAGGGGGAGAPGGPPTVPGGAGGAAGQQGHDGTPLSSLSLGAGEGGLPGTTSRYANGGTGGVGGDIGGQMGSNGGLGGGGGGSTDGGGGGAGGGGLYGGGQGGEGAGNSSDGAFAACGGGGGGSSLVPPGGTVSAMNTTGLPPRVTITYTAPDPTSTAVSCSPNSVPVGQSTTCTATVTDTDRSGQSTPSGSVSFTSSGSGSFSANSCTLSKGTGASARCSVSYTPSARAAGSQTITAGYPGDATHEASSGQTDLVIVVAPAAPTITSLANGDGQVAVSFTDADPGTSPITSYEVSATDLSDPTAPPVTAKGPSSPVTVKGLTNGDTYVFTVTATSADGTSPPSAPSGRLNVGVPPFVQSGPADGVVGQAYSSRFVITGAPPPTVIQVSGELPPGLTLSSDGTLVGTPTQAGTYEFTVEAVNPVGIDFADATVTIAPATPVGEPPPPPPHHHHHHHHRHHHHHQRN
jgi:hypothetical protein